MFLAGKPSALEAHVSVMPKRLGESSQRVFWPHAREGGSQLLGKIASRVSGVHNA